MIKNIKLQKKGNFFTVMSGTLATPQLPDFFVARLLSLQFIFKTWLQTIRLQKKTNFQGKRENNLIHLISCNFTWKNYGLFLFLQFTDFLWTMPERPAASAENLKWSFCYKDICVQNSHWIHTPPFYTPFCKSTISPEDWRRTEPPGAKINRHKITFPNFHIH